MYCPFCHQDETKVIDSRLVNDGQQVWRRRECVACSMRFTSYETAELNLPKIVKRDGSRQNFDEDKLRSGIMRALEKRPVRTEDCELAIASIKKLLLANGEREISSNQLGEWVMDALRALDEVAFVRFASVYRRFQDIHEFYDEIKNLKAQETL